MTAATTPSPDDALLPPTPLFDDWDTGVDLSGSPCGASPDEACDDAPSSPGWARDACPRLAATEAQLQAWILAIVDRDERALAALYDATFARVFGLVQRIVRDAALAEEVVEDAYFQVWRQALRYNPERGRALTWLLAMARSRAIDVLRREARFAHDALADDEGPQPQPGDQPAADELLDLARHRAELHRALMHLGAQPRQLVSMAFLRGLSHEEIAEQMDLPLGTVKSQIRRALQALRGTLAEPDSRLLAS